MKTWIQTGLVLFAMTASSTSFATAHEGYGLPGGSHGQPPPAGGEVRHEFLCSVPHSSSGMVAGVGYSAACETAALPPQYDVTGCELYSQVVYPGAQKKPIALKQVSQDAETAKFAGANGIKVTLDKSDFSMKVDFGNKIKITCVVKPDQEQSEDQEPVQQ